MITKSTPCSSTLAIADSGCTNHYICRYSPCTKLQPCINGIKVKQLDVVIMKSSHAALLDAPSLPLTVRKVHIFPSMQKKALLSLGKFCDNNYTFVLKKNAINNNHKDRNSFYLQGHRYTTSGMWTVGISSQGLRNPSEDIHAQANNVYKLKRDKYIITYFHKAYFSPVPSTWIDAINAVLFATWPGITAELVSKHLDKSPATTKVHLQQIRKNILSTKLPTSTRNPQQTAMTTSSTKNDVRATHLFSMKIT